MNVTWTLFAKVGGVIPNSRIKYTQCVFVQVSRMQIPSLKNVISSLTNAILSLMNADPKSHERNLESH